MGEANENVAQELPNTGDEQLIQLHDELLHELLNDNTAIDSSLPTSGDSPAVDQEDNGNCRRAKRKFAQHKNTDSEEKEEDVQGNDDDGNDGIGAEIRDDHNYSAQEHKKQRNWFSNKKSAKPKGVDRSDISWTERMQDLKEYKEKHGNCNVKQRPPTNLGRFVKKMREYKKQIDAGKYKGSVLTSERIKEMDDMGFIWSLQPFSRTQSFQERLEKLQAFKDKFGHCNVPRVYDEDMSLGRWCHIMRQSYRQIKEKTNPSYKLSESEIESLEKLGFKWRVANYERNKFKKATFEERLDQLIAYKAKYGNLQVSAKLDRSLNLFCANIRAVRRHPDRLNQICRLSEEKIKALDDIGFDWNPSRHPVRSFEERIQQLKAYKQEHGTLKVSQKTDQNLATFCANMRKKHPRKQNDMEKLNEEQVQALDDIGFDWDAQAEQSSFDMRILQLKAYKEKHGHLKVSAKIDEGLAKFCVNVRQRHPDKPNRQKTLSQEKVMALDDIGFDWNPQAKQIAFEERLEQLKAYKQEHGHVNVAYKQDKSLYQFCHHARQRHPDVPNQTIKLAEDRVKALNDLGFDWGGHITRNFVNNNQKKVTFEQRIDHLKAFKEKYGHFQVSNKVDFSLARFCANMRTMHPDKNNKVLKLTDDKVKALDAIGFDWNFQSRKKKRRDFETRIEQLKAYKAQHGNFEVSHSVDNSLASFCTAIRKMHPDTPCANGKLPEEKIKALNDIGFEWDYRSNKTTKRKNPGQAERY